MKADSCSSLHIMHFSLSLCWLSKVPVPSVWRTVLSRDFYNHHSILPPTWLAVNMTYTCALYLCLLPYYIFSNSRLCQNCPSPTSCSKFVFVYPCAVIWGTRWSPTLGPGHPSLFWVLQAFTQIQFTVEEAVHTQINTGKESRKFFFWWFRLKKKSR